mgnify:CR=1 FL=1
MMIYIALGLTLFTAVLVTGRYGDHEKFANVCAGLVCLAFLVSAVALIAFSN